MNDNTTAKADELLANLTEDESINLFIEGLIEEKGIDATSEELKKDIFDDLKSRLLEEIDRSLVAELPDDKLNELAKMAEENGKIEPEVVADMVNEANLDVQQIIGVTMAKFRDIYLGLEDENAEVENGAE